jgi:hypothetical protein
MSETSHDAFGLTGIAAGPIERVLVRQRESAVTTSAWRLDLTCDQGTGGIVRIETAGGDTFFRGDGLFLGWSQERLTEVYDALSRPTGGGGSDDLELMQLG